MRDTDQPGAPGSVPAAAGPDPASLWWERDSGAPAPDEPADGSVVRIVRADGVALLAERDDWSLRSDLTGRDGNPLADAHQRRWFVHDPQFLNTLPQRWDELVDTADRLIIFVAVPPAGTPIEHLGHTRKPGPATSELGSPIPTGGGEEPLPAEVQRYLDTVYGPRPNDRADWAHRTARILLAGGEPTEPMPRDQYGVTPSRVDALRQVVASATGRDGRHA